MPAHSAPAASYTSRITDRNQIAVTLTNYGVIGNNFVDFSPSLRYPARTGYEHLKSGGLWIGARATDAVGDFTGVTTAMFDSPVGYTTYSETEFTPASKIVVRSTLPSSPYFSPDAISEEDLVSEFDDLTAKRPVNNPEPHRPLGVKVRQESYSWVLDGYGHVVFLHFVITNVGSPLRDAWVGLFAEFASGRGPYHIPWFSKKWIAYDPGYRLFREHYCEAQPVPAGCNLAYVPYWIGMDVLGVRPGSIADKKITVAAWNWSPGDPARAYDVQRYAIMSAGTVQDLTTPDLLPVTGDPVELVAVGPFAEIAPGDSVQVDFALVGGAEIADIQTHASQAQILYDAGYVDPATPVTLSLVSASAEPGRVRLAWHSPLGPAFTGSVERRGGTGDWTNLGSVSADGSGLIRFEDRNVTAAGRYEYRVCVREGGAASYFGEVWVDVPGFPEFGVHGTVPSPATSSDLAVSFSLASGERAKLELIDIGGRRVVARDVGGLGAGRHLVRIGAGRDLAPGAYVVRLTQGGRSATAKAVVLR